MGSRALCGTTLAPASVLYLRPNNEVQRPAPRSDLQLPCTLEGGRSAEAFGFAFLFLYVCMSPLTPSISDVRRLHFNLGLQACCAHNEDQKQRWEDSSSPEVQFAGTFRMRARQHHVCGHHLDQDQEHECGGAEQQIIESCQVGHFWQLIHENCTF